MPLGMCTAPRPAAEYSQEYPDHPLDRVRGTAEYPVPRSSCVAWPECANVSDRMLTALHSACKCCTMAAMNRIYKGHVKESLNALSAYLPQVRAACDRTCVRARRLAHTHARAGASGGPNPRTRRHARAAGGRGDVEPVQRGGRTIWARADPRQPRRRHHKVLVHARAQTRRQ